MQHLGANFGGIWRFKLGFFIDFCFFRLRNLGCFLKVQWQHCPHSTASLRHVVYTRIVQCHYLSVLIRDHVMHPNTSVSSVNEHC